MWPVVICEMYGWTLEEYLDHPVQFIELIKSKISIDGQKAQREKQSMKTQPRR